MTTADLIAQSARLGWMPSYPTFDRNPLDLADEIAAAGQEPRRVRRRAAAGAASCGSPSRTRTRPENWPRVLTLWRANLLGSSAKGDEYFLRHLLGTHDNAAGRRRRRRRPGRATSPGATRRPRGKLDLLLSLDFRMTSSTLLSDVVLPAATWYEKHDLNTTDMHPFVHAFNPAIDPPWEARTDFDAFHAIAGGFSRARRTHLGVRRDVVAVPLQHDTPARPRSPAGSCRTGGRASASRCPGGRCRTSSSSSATTPPSRTKMARARAAGRPARADDQGRHVPAGRGGRRTSARKNGVILGGAADGRPPLDTDAKLAEAILALVRHHERPAGRAGLPPARGAHRHAAGRPRRRAARRSTITFADTQARPVPVITSPEWSGSETGGRRYAPFTVNVERLKPWHTLTGRMHFFLDHDWMHELGETLPIYRPPLDMHGCSASRRSATRRRVGHRALPDPALEVVDPLRVPGQPVHAVAVPRRARRSG